MPDQINDIVFLRKRQIIDELGIDDSTLVAWVKAGRFPVPRILNQGSAREIPVWDAAEFRQWKASLPQRPARRIGGRRRRLILRRPSY
jgi:predicted DNA-binding transcriptional regulator AlpA